MLMLVVLRRTHSLVSSVHTDQIVCARVFLHIFLHVVLHVLTLLLHAFVSHAEGAKLLETDVPHSGTNAYALFSRLHDAWLTMWEDEATACLQQQLNLLQTLAQERVEATLMGMNFQHLTNRVK